MPHELPLRLPRSAFTPREVARAGDLWRLFQEAAVEGSRSAGWPPERYREVGGAFFVRSMRVRHHREAIYGEPTLARTWPSQLRRGIFFTREVRLLGEDGPIASTTQEWVYASASLRPERGPEALLSCFPAEALEGDPSVEEPAFEARESGSVSAFEFHCWQTWMDPLAHLNHPVYVDLIDEGVARAAAEAGLDPVRLQPAYEELTFRSGVTAGERVRVESELAGLAPASSFPEGEGAALVLRHKVLAGPEGDPRLCARGLSFRRLLTEAGAPEPEAAALMRAFL